VTFRVTAAGEDAEAIGAKILDPGFLTKVVQESTEALRAEHGIDAQVGATLRSAPSTQTIYVAIPSAQEPATEGEDMGAIFAAAVAVLVCLLCCGVAVFCRLWLCCKRNTKVSDDWVSDAPVVPQHNLAIGN